MLSWNELHKSLLLVASQDTNEACLRVLRVMPGEEWRPAVYTGGMTFRNMEFPLLATLIVTHQQLCSDPRDKRYGVVGISDENGAAKQHFS
jgi:hypothetical protein